MGPYLDLSLITRPVALRAWLVYNGISYADLAEELNVDPSFICRFMSGERRSARLQEHLLQKGVPPSLLPD